MPMNPWSLLVALPPTLLAPALTVFAWRRVSARRALSTRNGWQVASGAALGGALALYVQDALFTLTGLSLESGRTQVLGVLLAMVLLVSPLEHGLEVLSLVRLVRRRVIDGAHLGLLYAACAAAGFSAVVTFHYLAFAPPDALRFLRATLGALGHLFFAGIWGFALGSGHGARRGRWFPAAWLTAAALHGLFSLVVFGLPPGALITAMPLVLVMTATAWIGLRDAGVIPTSQLSFLASIEPPSIEAVRRALSHRNRPLMPHWIALATLVTLGLMITMLAGAVLLGHRIGVDFALAEQGDWRATAPLALLGSAVLAAYPIAGFLVARATAAASVLEPALGALVAIGFVVAGLGVTVPFAVVFALASAPVAVALACFGAWFGLSS